MNLRCYSDHGSPVRRARDAARSRMPCPGCGSPSEPAMRRPRYFSDLWHRCPDTYFGCRQCGHRLAAIEGPAADRESEVAVDRIPDPKGTVRALAGRDPLMLRRLGDGLRDRSPDGPGPARTTVVARLREFMGPALEGVELRELRASEPGAFGPFLLTHLGLPWIPLLIESVDEIEMPTGIRPGLDRCDSLRSPTVEAAFVVAIDPGGRWRVREICSGATTD